VPHTFIFTEWRTASAVARKTREPGSTFKNNPYRDWAEQKLDGFLIELAMLAGSGNKLLVGGSVYTKVFHDEKSAGTCRILPIHTNTVPTNSLRQ